MEDLFRSRIADCIERFERQNIPVNTDFLDPSQQGICHKICRSAGCSYAIEGGYESAERRILFLFPDYQEEPDIENVIVPLSVCLANNRMEHGDFLGAIMGLGVKRSCIGDILVDQSGATLLCTSVIAPFILTNLTSVGRHNVHVESFSLSDIQVTDEDTRNITGTVAALRLDAVASVAFHVSRSKISEEIMTGNVSVNWIPTTNRAKVLKKNDVISIRKKGRAKITECDNISRKGRIFVTLSVVGKG